MTPRQFGLIAGLAFLAVGSCAGCGLRSALMQPDVPYWAVPNGYVPTGAYPVTPEPMWLAEYSAAEQCSGLKGKADAVLWHLVPGNGFKMPVFDGEKTDTLILVGMALRGHIYIAESRRNFEWIARHESLHDILQGGGHNVTLFGEQCRAMQGYLE
jgi:hypothetical protein